jgi:hypothetical protein
MGIWRLKRMRGNTDQGISNKNWRDELMEKKFTSTDPEIGIIKNSL